MSPSSSSPLALPCLVAALVLVLQGGGLGGGEQGQAAAMNVPGEEEILLFFPARISRTTVYRNPL